MNRKRRRIFARSAAVTLAASMLLTTGCGSTDKEEESTMTLIVKSHDEYWDTVKKGAEDACEEMGYTLSILEPDYENDSVQQRRFIEQAVTDGTKAIIIAPASATGMNESLDTAVSANIPVIAVESDTAYSAKETLIATNQTSAGGIAARATLSAIPGGGDIAIITHNPDALISIDRIESYLDNLPYKDLTGEMDDGSEDDEDSEEHEDEDNGEDNDEKGENEDEDTDAPFHLVATKNCDNNVDIAALNAKELIANNPDLKVIFCTNQISTIGACRSVKEAGKSGQIAVIGFEASNEQIEFIKDGTLTGTVVQNLYNMGYLGIRYADKVLGGEDIPPNIDTGVCFVTKDNLENPDVQLLLNPGNN